MTDNKLPIKDLARITSAKEIKQIQPIEANQTKKQKREPRLIEVAPDGLNVMNELVAFCGSVNKAAVVLGVAGTNFSDWKKTGKVRKSFADLAKYYMADERRKAAPKPEIELDTFVAVVALKNEYKQSFIDVLASCNAHITFAKFN